MLFDGAIAGAADVADLGLVLCVCGSGPTDCSRWLFTGGVDERKHANGS